MFKEKIKNLWNTYKTSKLIWGVLIAVVIILLATLIKGKSTTNPNVATVARGDVVDSVVLSGRTASASAVKLGFADQGRVSHVYVKEGDHVSQGQLLASLDTSDLPVSDVEKVIREQDALVANAYRNLTSTGLQAFPENTSTSIAAPTISGVYQGAEGQYRIRIYESSGTTKRSFEVSGLEQGMVQPVTTNTAVALGTRGLYIQFNDIPDAGYWVIDIPNKRSVNYATYFNAYESAKATRDRVVSDTRLNNDSVISRINKRKIYAPFSGTIASVGIKQGESTGSVDTTSADSGATITLISENDYEVTLKAPEISVAKLSVGQEVSLNLDAYGKDVIFPGKITSINPAETIIDGVPVYETKVSFSNKDDRIRSGMTTTATIITNRKDNVIVVPANYIHTDKEGAYVFVLNDEKTEKRVITTGLRGSDSLVEIVNGLSEGEQVRTDELK
jgi:multidrug efflux pump subunit AcrA (membrane-fusion protein)